MQKRRKIIPTLFIISVFFASVLSGCGSNNDSVANDINSLFENNPLDGNGDDGIFDSTNETNSDDTTYKSPDGMEGSENIYGNYRNFNSDNGNMSGNINGGNNANTGNMGSSEIDGDYGSYYNGFGSERNNIYGNTASDFNNVGYTPRSQDNMSFEMSPENLTS